LTSAGLRIRAGSALPLPTVTQVTVIIPLHRRTPAVARCVERAAEVAGARHQVLVVSDHAPDALPAGTTSLVTGAPADTSPAEKRDFALPHATGEICAFLDDDAYPRDDWIAKALARFAADPGVAAVGGPGVTPPESGWRERASGAFYESRLGSGRLRFRFRPVGTVREVDDLPAYNLLIRTEALRAIGGWQSRLYGGEDTKTCLRLRQSGRRLVYDPEVVVFHHRRPILGPHLRQVGNVGRHRGYFARTLPETTRRPLYFAPTVAVALASLAGVAAVRSRRARVVGSLATAAFWAQVTRDALRDGCEPTVAAVLPGVIAASHFVYGLQFARGLVTPHIEAM
jgi:glycosyltransferase involved in cell wall biosynthesis